VDGLKEDKTELLQENWRMSEELKDGWKQLKDERTDLKTRADQLETKNAELKVDISRRVTVSVTESLTTQVCLIVTHRLPINLMGIERNVTFNLFLSEDIIVFVFDIIY